MTWWIPRNDKLKISENKHIVKIPNFIGIFVFFSYPEGATDHMFEAKHALCVYFFYLWEEHVENAACDRQRKNRGEESEEPGGREHGGSHTVRLEVIVQLR